MGRIFGVEEYDCASQAEIEALDEVDEADEGLGEEVRLMWRLLSHYKLTDVRYRYDFDSIIGFI